jgi:hypothetical protein
LVRPIDYYDKNNNKLLSISFTDENKVVPNIIAGIRFGKDTPQIKPLNWTKVDDDILPVFPPFIKINDL